MLKYLILVVLLATHASADPVWPPVSFPPSTQALSDEALKVWSRKPPNFRARFGPHEPFGNYLNTGIGQQCSDGGRIRLDANGVAQREYRGKFSYHPVLAAQCGLRAHALFLEKKASLQDVTLYPDHLIVLQDQQGALRYPFDYHYYLTNSDLPAGWVSAMAQGQALSLFARAYDITGDDRYIDAGKKALKFMLTPTSEGGTLTSLSGIDQSLSNFIFLEEYVSNPPNYTLNGYMFALLGLYDWSQITQNISADQQTAAEFFQRGIETLKAILPYYDTGSISTYDLGYITFKTEPHILASYHGVHLYLLDAMHSITDEQIFADYRDRWIDYVSKQ